jgi:hypothetical protein
MNFVFVNGRTPCRWSACALCGEKIGNFYLRELGTQLYYCDHDCYVDHCNRVTDFNTKAALNALALNRLKKSAKPELMLST